MSFIDKWLPRQFFFSLRWQFVSNAAQGIFGGLYLILLGRVLGVTQFGIYSLATSLVAIAFMFVELRLHEVVIRFVCPMDKSFTSEQGGICIADLLCMDVVVRSILLVVVLLLLPWIGKVWAVTAPTTEVLLACAVVYFLAKAGNSTAIGLLRVLNRFDAAAKLVACEWFVKLVSLAFLSIWFQLTVVQAVVLAGVAGLASNAMMIALAAKSWNETYSGTIRLRFQGMGQRLAGIRRYIYSNLGVSLSDLLVRDLDVAITGSFLSLELVGIYKMSKNVVQMMWRVVDPFFLVLMPELRKMRGENDVETLVVFIKTIARLLFVVSLCLVAIVWACLVLFGIRIFGIGFSGISTIFPYMAVWVIVSAPLLWAHPLASSAGHPEVLLIGTFFANLVGLAMFVPLVYFLGITGAGIGWSLTSMLGFVATAYLCKRLGLLNKGSDR